MFLKVQEFFVDILQGFLGFYGIEVWGGGFGLS